MELSKARSMVELIMTMVQVFNKEKRRSCNHCKELEGVRNKPQDKGIMYRGFVSLDKVQ